MLSVSELTAGLAAVAAGVGAMAAVSSPSAIPALVCRLLHAAPLPGTAAPLSIGSGGKKPFSIPQIASLSCRL